MKPPPGSGQVEGYVAAYDIRTGEKKWSTPSPTVNLASLLATEGGLVFGGDPDGVFFALDAQTGKRLWSFATGGGHRGSSVTYTAGGRQFVATPVGWGSIAGGIVGALFPNAPQPRPGSALVVFALPEGSR